MLSMYLDGELDHAASQTLAAHLTSCQRCGQTVRRWEAVQRAMGEAFMRRTESRSEVRDSACTRPAELSSYANGLLTEHEQEAVEDHLRRCDPCLAEVMALRHTLRRLRKDQWLSPPDPLAQRARQAIMAGEQTGGIRQLGRVVIQVAKRGLKVLDLSGASPALDLQVLLLPTPATAFRRRSEDDQSGWSQALEIQAMVGTLELTIKLLHEQDETVGGTIWVQKEGQPLSRARVTLRKAGRTVYSRRLSLDGHMNLPQLTPGEYVMSIPEEGVETMVLLQASAEGE